MKITMQFDRRSTGQLAQRLAHQPRLQARKAVAHLALELGARRQRRNRIDHQHINRAGAHQRIGDLQRLLAGIGLRNQQLIEIDAELAGIDRIERMLGIDEGRRCRPSSGLRRPRAAPASSCPSFQARRSRSSGHAAGRRCQARCRAPASRSESFRSRPRLIGPSFMIEPLPNARSIWESAASSAFFVHGFFLYQPQRVLCHSVHL
jgi:hypothetical protein